MPLSEPILPERLKHLRENFLDTATGEQGLTQAALARRLGISLIAIKKYESGESIPTSEILVKMCELYQVALYFSPDKIHPLLLKRRQERLS